MNKIAGATLFFFISLNVYSDDKGVDRVMNMIMKDVRESSSFNESMTCMGVSEEKKNKYFELYEKEYRYCLVKFPQSADGGTKFISCFSPKYSDLFKNMKVSKEKMKKCN